MSLRYNIAVAIIDGNAYLEQFSPSRIAARDVCELAARVAVEIDPEMDRVYPDLYAGIVHIETKDGRRFSRRVDHSKGMPENPMQRRESDSEFISLASSGVGDDQLAPGISAHHIGGHTAGLQVVRVHRVRGWVVIASDASHYYEHFERQRAFPLVYHVGELIDGYRRLGSLAESPRHIIPGHNPLVIQRYPAASDALRGIAVRLDLDPL